MPYADFMDVISLLYFVEVLGEPAISVREYFTFHSARVKWPRSCHEFLHRVSIFCRLIYPGRRKYAAAAEIIEPPHHISLLPQTNTHQMVDGAGKLEAQRSGRNRKFITATTKSSPWHYPLSTMRPLHVLYF